MDFALLVGLGVVRERCVTAQTPRETTREIDGRSSAAEINALVRQLGGKTYRARERAEQQLEAMGLVAFEALLDQRNHEDIEIRLRARRLVDKLRTRFLREGVDAAFEPILSRYAQLSEEQRKVAIEWLAVRLPQQAINELSRIARFEENTRLSKLAALAIMEVPYPSSASARLQRAERIDEAIGFGQRDAVRWLRLYASALRGDSRSPQSANLWEAMIEDERRLIDQERNGESSLAVLRAMQRLSGDLCELSGKPDDALAARQRVNGGAFGDRQELIGWMTWLLRRSAWSAVVDLASQHENEFARNPILMYGLAEAHLQTGSDASTVKDLADAANGALPVAEVARRYQAADFLEDERGQFEWAEREYRHIIQHGPTESRFRPISSYRLAQMLHSMGQGKAAHDVMHEMFEEAEASKPYLDVIEQIGWEPNGLEARSQLYLATYYRDQGNLKEAKAALSRAVERDPDEADVLIAMYRIDDDDATWKAKTMRAIQNASERFRRTIYESRRASEQGNDREEPAMPLANALNQLAWLVSNTEGDYTEALRMSKKSLELEPGDAGIMDTLGRCYYSVKDYKNAVKYQRWAHERSPHDGHIRRQLELFEKALADSENS